MKLRVYIAASCVVIALGAITSLLQADKTRADTQPGQAGEPSEVAKPGTSARLNTRSRLEPQIPLQPESRIGKILRGEELPPLSTYEIASYLEANRRNAASLLAAKRVTGDGGDGDLFKEALARFPNDPRVAFEAWRLTRDLEKKRTWLEVMSKNDPQNALANYLLAENHFKAGNSAEAIHQLEIAAARPQLSFHWRESVLEAEQAYRAAGYSEAEAKFAASSSLPLPHLAQMKSLVKSLGELSQTYLQAGDAPSAEAVLNLGFQLADRVAPTDGLMIEQLVGNSIRDALLRQSDPSAFSHVPGKTYGELREELRAQSALIRNTGREMEAVLSRVTEQDLAAFLDRSIALGELEAMQWLRNKYQE